MKFGGPVKSLNVGGMRYEPGKRQIAQAISINDEDVTVFKELIQHQVTVEGRAVPTDSALDLTKYF